MKKAIIYTRKSTDEVGKQQLSIETQLDWCRQYAERWEFFIVDTIVEAESASSLGRSWFAKMIDLLDKWEAEYIIVHHIDRISRNSLDEWNIKWMAQQGKIKEIHSIEWVFNGQKILFLSIHLSMATQFSIDLKKRVEEWIRTKLKQGGIVGAVPFWYKNNRDTKQADLDIENAHFVKKMFDMRLSWSSIAHILDYMLSMDVKTVYRRNKPQRPITKATIEAILKNPFYYGMISYKWELFEWKHTPIISREIFDCVNKITRGVQYIHGKKLTPLKWKVFYAWVKLCDSLIKKQYIYFHLHSRKWSFWIRQSDILESFEQEIDFYRIPEIIKHEFYEKMWWETQQILDEQRKKINLLQTKISTLNNEENWLITMMAKWLIDDEKYKEMKNEVVKKRESLKSNLEKEENKEVVIRDETIKMVELWTNRIDKRKTLDEHMKADTLSKIMVELSISEKKEVSYAEKPPFNILRNLNKSIWSEGQANGRTEYYLKFLEMQSNFIEIVKSVCFLWNTEK